MTPSVDVLLLNPPVHADRYFKTEHLGLAYLAASLDAAGFSSVILDAQLESLNTLQCFSRLLAAGEPRLFLAVTTVGEFTTNAALELVEALRGAGWRVPVVLGGFDATLHHRLIIPRLGAGDVVVLGDGEATACELAGRAARGESLPGCAGTLAQSGRGERPRMVDLDELPLPRRDGTRRALRQGLPPVVVGSRGCPGKCGFCTIQEFHATSAGARYRPRSPENVFRELVALREDHGVDYVFFVDDTFIGPGARGRARAEKLAECIHEAGIRRWTIQCRVDQIDPDLFATFKRYGLSSLFTGVESCIPRIADEFGKGACTAQLADAVQIVSDLGLELLPTYIFWDAGMTFDELRQQLEFMRDCGPATPIHLHSLRVWPTSDLQDRLEAEGRSLGFPERHPRYLQADPRVELFCRIVEPDYQRVYLPSFDGVYRAHFAALLVGDDELRDRLRSRVFLATAELRAEHAGFVDSLLGAIEAGDLSGFGRRYQQAAERLGRVDAELKAIRRTSLSAVADQLARHDA